MKVVCTGRILYMQCGDSPSEQDEELALVCDPVRAKYLAEILNEHFEGDHECSIGKGQMTDRAKLIALLAEWDVPWTQGEYDAGEVIVGGGYAQKGNVTGYTGFFTSFTFTPDGKFTSMGAWE